MFVEFTGITKQSVLVNTEYVIGVVESGPEQVLISLRERPNLTVLHSFDEVKKRLGLSISPRAETLVKGVA